MFALLLAAATTPTPPKPAADGPFQLVVREVVCRHEFGRSAPACEVGLDLRWDAPLAVVRVAQTRLAGWTPSSFPAGKIAVGGSRHATTVRATGVRRTDLTLPLLEVGFTVTAAERTLTFTVPDLAAPVTRTEAGVTLATRPPRRLDAFLELRLDLLYPEGHPEFESFETWTANNRCRLLHRDGRSLEPVSFDEDPRGRAVACAYRFKASDVGDPAGWSLSYDTPGPAPRVASTVRPPGHPPAVRAYHRCMRPAVLVLLLCGSAGAQPPGVETRRLLGRSEATAKRLAEAEQTLRGRQGGRRPRPGAKTGGRGRRRPG